MKTRKITLNSWLQEASEKHDGFYDYINVTSYKNSQDIFDIVCPLHGTFQQRAWLHLKGRGCPTCRYLKPKTGGRIQHDDMIARFTAMHGLLYDYSKVNYVTIDTEVEIVCPVHGSFMQKPRNHFDGHGCKRCSTGNRSKVEETWLSSFDVDIVRQHRITLDDGTMIVADGYDMATNTVYEFWGSFWHGDPRRYKPEDIHPVTKRTYSELYQETVEKARKIRASGFNLVEMWEIDYNELFKNLR